LVPVWIPPGSAGLGQDHHEQRPHGEQMGGPHDLCGRPDHGLGQRVGQVGPGHQAHGEDHEQHHRLGDRASLIAVTAV